MVQPLLTTTHCRKTRVNTGNGLAHAHEINAGKCAKTGVFDNKKPNR
jgi:hypothetical protein